MDLIVIGGLLLFFAVAAGYVVFCDRVVAPAPSELGSQRAEADADG
jgi:hypothetical protein